jgi:LacI family transcriptional regulator
VASVGEDDDLLQSLAGVRTPMVIVDRELEGVDADLVRIDHEQALTWPPATCWSWAIATSPISAAPPKPALANCAWRLPPCHGRSRCACAASRVLHSDFTSPGGHAAAAQVLEGKRPSAIFAGNDMIGFGVLRAAAERNISVPGELSVIGFDDIELSRYVYPALTTVGQSIRELGESGGAAADAYRRPELWRGGAAHRRPAHRLA